MFKLLDKYGIEINHKVPEYNPFSTSTFTYFKVYGDPQNVYTLVHDMKEKQIHCIVVVGCDEDRKCLCYCFTINSEYMTKFLELGNDN